MLTKLILSAPIIFAFFSTPTPGQAFDIEGLNINPRILSAREGVSSIAKPYQIKDLRIIIGQGYSNNLKPELRIDKDMISVESVVYSQQIDQENMEIKIYYRKQNPETNTSYGLDNKIFPIQLTISFLFKRPLYSTVSNPDDNIQIVADGKVVDLSYNLRELHNQPFDAIVNPWYFYSDIYTIGEWTRQTLEYYRRTNPNEYRRMTNELIKKIGMNIEKFSVSFNIDDLQTIKNSNTLEIRIFNDKYVLPYTSIINIKKFYESAIKAINTSFPSTPSRNSPFAN
jgi:hypothetical protein